MRPLLLALACAALLGCGSASGSTLGDVAEATSAETSRVEMSYHIAASDEAKDYDFRAEGVFDYPNERGAMTAAGWAPFFGDKVELKEFRLLGRAGYTRWEVKGKTYWLKQVPVEMSGDPAELLIPGPGTPTQPTEVLMRVLRASDENEELGKEDVRGVETTHYRARVNLKELVNQLSPDERPEGDVEPRRGLNVVPVELWIDNESRLRRIEITYPAHDENPEQTMSVELFDYGVEVDVGPPPEAETISQAEFDKLTADSKSTYTLEPREAEPVTPEEASQPGNKESE